MLAQRPADVSALLDDEGDFSDEAKAVLESGQADVVVVPYSDLRWSSYSWPPDEFAGPGEAAANDAAGDHDLTVERDEYFALVDLAGTAGAP